MKRLFITSLLFFSFSAIAQNINEEKPYPELHQSIEFTPVILSNNNPLRPLSAPRKAKLAYSQTIPSTQLVGQINQAIMQQQWDKLPDLLLQYQQLPTYDQGLVHYALANVYYAKQDYATAIYHYRALLKQHPNIIYPRFDFAITLFEDFQYRSASKQLQHVLPFLSGTVQTLAQQYYDALQKQQRWQIEVNFQYIQTDNVNQASSAKTIELNGKRFIKTADSLPQKANGIKYQIGVQRLIPLKDHHFIQPELHYNGIYYWNNQDYNEQTLHLGLSYLYQRALSGWQITPFIEKNWFAHSHYSDYIGGRLTHYQRFPDNYALQNQFTYTHKRYQDTLLAKRYNGQQFDALTILSWKILPSTTLFTGLNVQRDVVNEKASSSKKWQIMLGGQYVNHIVGNQLTLRYAQRHFAAPHYLLQYERKDQEYQIDYALWSPKLVWQGFLPKLHFHYQQIDSNIPVFYSRKNHMIFLTVGKIF
ncbi:surface lipoprotein assembly modifier [Gallibacterium trehalosifermentans]|uniref:Surface lipoprotein assembly modifier n=1 Tax=Gallibacterium trehalosifermentans TaxID=516935 RepID=A0ABV6H1R5_9PAST